tara:strand:- start:1456 stop:2328 length:873 start_codon:yes stop_codon:yes gene_type:complete
MFTIIFLSFHSEKHIKRLIANIEKKYPIIVIENSLNHDLKTELEKKFENVKVIVPSKNLGIPAGYNLGIKEAKTDLVKLTSADVEISNKSLNDLYECALKIKDFAILAPTYEDESIYKNYRIWNTKKFTSVLDNKLLAEYGIKEVDFAENDFLINKRNFKNQDFFDENIFLYYETMDLCMKVRSANKKIYISEKIKFKHYGSQSVSSEFSYNFSLSRSWHYNWSKFYYFKKNFGYFFALKKILPNLIRAVKNIIFCIISNKKEKLPFHKAELFGGMASILKRPSNYRPFE